MTASGHGGLCILNVLECIGTSTNVFRQEFNFGRNIAPMIIRSGIVRQAGIHKSIGIGRLVKFSGIWLGRILEQAPNISRN